ncbi:small subunit of acetolactate synthase-domain-containing protein [Chlamydoabsidia padenii]|nr:small subunit of acetolactate synthase-domain-containing protein [Chlamydoabsidia padenii]
MFRSVFTAIPTRRWLPARYKSTHFYKKQPPTVKSTVTSILYNTPTTSPPHTRHILHCLVENEIGVLSRVSGVLGARNYNIDSLVVANTDVPNLSRMTVVFNGDSVGLEQARRQLEDLVPVWAVLDYTNTKLVERELLLIKVSILGPNHLHEQMPTTIFHTGVPFTDERLEQDHIPPSDTLRETFSHLRALTELTRLFDGKVVDVSSDSIVVELCAKHERIDSFVNLCKPFGILEASRTGMMAMPRTPVHDNAHTDQVHEDDHVDPTMLPPG